jgi:hypothetical protein
MKKSKPKEHPITILIPDIENRPRYIRPLLKHSLSKVLIVRNIVERLQLPS